MPNKLSRYCEGVMEACWLMALVLAPLFFNVYSSRVFEPDKISLIRSLALIALAAWILKLGAAGLPRVNYSPAAFFKLPLVAPVSALAGVYILATVFSITPTVSLLGSYQRLQGTFSTLSYVALFAALAGNLRQRAQVERAVTTVIITSLPVSLYGVLQHYNLDPLPWGGDTSTRVTSSMGNAIFVAAYLIMAVPLTLGRVVTTFRSILTESNSAQMPVTLIRATAYVFILALNLIAIWFSGSRGPWLGLLAGLFFFFVLLALRWRNWALGLGTIALAALLGAGILVFNIPNGPLESLRQVPGLGRLGDMLNEIEGRSGTGRVRVLIWGGVVELMSPHTPIEFPSGTVDPLNGLRWLIGYGPESLYVSFNRFYPPELGQLEARNASPDRSHNETFDALAFTGVLGLCVYLALFVALFYYALKWVGLINTPQRRNVFLILLLGGGVAGAIGFVLWQGPELFGVGLPFGMLLGLIAFLTIYALQAVLGGNIEVDSGAITVEPWRAIVLISLFSAVVAYFTEIHFGIAIVSTRTHFWLYTALMLTIGFAMPALQSNKAAPDQPAAATALSRRKRRAAITRETAPAGSWQWSLMAIGAGLTTVVLFTQGFNFITNATRSTSAMQILTLALTLKGNAPSFGILGLFLATWLAGSIITQLEETPNATLRPALVNIGTCLLLSLVLSGIGWLLISNWHAGMAGITIKDMPSLFASVDLQAGLLAFYYFILLLLLAGLAVALPSEWPSFLSSSTGIPWLGFAGGFAVLLALVLAATLNLRPIQADIVYKTAFQLDNQGQPQVAIPLFQRAIALAPSQDYYYLFLGRAYLNTLNSISDPQERLKMFTTTEKELTIAQNINPLNTDHTANLARFHSQWAMSASDEASRQFHAQQSDLYFAKATNLSPNNAGLWNEWAKVSLQVLNNPEQAQAKLTRSLSLDAKFSQTYQLQGDLSMWQAQHTTDAATQQTYYQQAITAYLKCIEIEQSAHNVKLRADLAVAYEATRQWQAAIEQYQFLVTWNDSGVEMWRVYARIAALYQQLGDFTQARAYGQKSLEGAPEANKAELQNWLNNLP